MLRSLILLLSIIVLWIFYLQIQKLFYRHKLSSYIDYCRLYGYSQAEFYTNKSKGFIYRKRISVSEIENQLKIFGHENCIIPSDTIIYENIAMIIFPYWEERYDFIVTRHGGRRFILFYSIEEKKDKEHLQRPYRHYLNDECGEFFDEDIIIDGDLLDGSIRYQRYSALEDFVNDELKYWLKR